MNTQAAHFRIDYKDWMKGNNGYDDYPVGGLRKDSVGYNSFKYPGLLVAQRALNETAITGSVKRSAPFTWAIDLNLVTHGFGAIGLAVDADPLAGSTTSTFYFLETNGALTSLANGTKTYRKGFSYGTPFSSYTLFSSPDNYTAVQDATPTIIDEGYRTTLGLPALISSYPHPFAKLDDILYVADGCFLTDITNVGNHVFTLDGIWTITEMTEHRGYLYMAATEFFGSTTVYEGAMKSKLFIWDGFTIGYLDSFNLPERVTAIRSGSDGRLYLWTIKSFGYMNGLEFIPLRAIDTSVYRDDIIDVPGGFLYGDGTKLVAYRSPVPGARRRFYEMENYTHNISSLMKFTTELCVMLDGGSTNNGLNTLYGVVDTQVGVSARSFEFNPRFTRVPVHVRGVDIETAGLGASGVITVKFRDSKGVLNTVGSYSYADAAMAATQRWTLDYFGDDPTTEIDPVIELTGTAKLKSVDFYYEAASDVGNA